MIQEYRVYIPNELRVRLKDQKRAEGFQDAVARIDGLRAEVYCKETDRTYSAGVAFEPDVRSNRVVRLVVKLQPNPSEGDVSIAKVDLTDKEFSFRAERLRGFAVRQRPHGGSR